MVPTDTSAVKPRLPAHKRPIADRPTPAVNIRVHTDTYDELKRITQRSGLTFDQLIKALLSKVEDPGVLSPL